ncbi:MAG: 50S ribosomal protein L4 [Thermodesulfobacteriota bacterium]
MPQVEVLDIERNKVGSLELNPEIFELDSNEHLLHAVVNWQLAKMRSGTASTKTRGEVSGGGKKPWKQKHMGRARHGSIRSPLWRKGGVVFGPKPKDWSYKINKKVRKKALYSALSLKLKEGKLFIIDDLRLEEIKTKKIFELLNKFGIENALIVVNELSDNLKKSTNNVKNVKAISVIGINVYDILSFDSLIFTEESIKILSEA